MCVAKNVLGSTWILASLAMGTRGLYTRQQASITCGWCSLFTVQTRGCNPWFGTPPPPLLVTPVHPADTH